MQLFLKSIRVLNAQETTSPKICVSVVICQSQQKAMKNLNDTQVAQVDELLEIIGLPV